MAKNTFQGLIRSTNGRPLSGYDKLLGRVRPMLVANPVCLMQLDLVAGTETDTNIGLLPAGLRILGIEVISAGTSGTFNLKLPAYDGLAEVLFFAGAQNVNAIAALTASAAIDGYKSDKDRPIYLTTATLVGAPTIGIWCVGSDDARRSSL
jgi:hypothetical protein